jgi:hypothetical protein
MSENSDHTTATEAKEKYMHKFGILRNEFLCMFETIWNQSNFTYWYLVTTHLSIGWNIPIYELIFARHLNPSQMFVSMSGAGLIGAHICIGRGWKTVD